MGFSSIRNTSSARILGRAVPIRLSGIMRTVIYLQENRSLLGQSRAVQTALRIPVEGPFRQRESGRDIGVATGKAEHELVRRMRVPRRNSRALLEPHQRNRGPGILVAPQCLVGQT